MITETILPPWLDQFIYQTMQAHYKPALSDMTVIHWDKQHILNYLGTYFPRSYAESFSIFTDNFDKIAATVENKEKIRLLDFCCGCGGEIVGFLMWANENLAEVECVEIEAIDGNYWGLELLKEILKETRKHICFDISLHTTHKHIDNSFSLILNSQFDIIFTFKAINEFVINGVFGNKNPYSIIAFELFKYLEDDGILLIEDIRTQCTQLSFYGKWYNKLLEEGTDCLPNSEVFASDDMATYSIWIQNHFRRDDSKVAWRFIRKRHIVKTEEPIFFEEEKKNNIQPQEKTIQEENKIVQNEPIVETNTEKKTIFARIIDWICSLIK